MTNPPFGRRVGGRSGSERLEHLWQAIGHRLGGLPADWRIALLTADRRLALKTGLPLKSAFLTKHGGLPVRAMVAGPERVDARADADASAARGGNDTGAAQDVEDRVDR